ncbi:hypothetical protein IL306_010676 [Fusarium sp. DS 682]|nr:hypothetical protein IL306_010676 [Fusarium sp. DS 682]
MTASPTTFYDTQFGETSSGTGLKTGCPEALVNHHQAQIPCQIDALSCRIDSFARARVLAVMAMNILVFDTPLDGRRDRWMCPFQTCKEGFSDPKKMMLHALYCDHVSAHGAYCNCCSNYYNFPERGQAYPTNGFDGPSSSSKDSTMSKLKRKTAGLIARCRSPSASNMSPASPTSSAASTFSNYNGMSGVDSRRRESNASSFYLPDAPAQPISPVSPVEMYGDPLVELDDSSRPHELSAVTQTTDPQTWESSQPAIQNTWPIVNHASQSTSTEEFFVSPQDAICAASQTPGMCSSYGCYPNFASRIQSQNLAAEATVHVGSQHVDDQQSGIAWEAGDKRETLKMSTNLQFDIGITQAIASKSWQAFINPPGLLALIGKQSSATLNLRISGAHI